MDNKQNWATKLLYVGLITTIIGSLSVFFAGYGYQLDWWSFRGGFKIIPWGTGSAVLGGVITTLGFFILKNRTRIQIGIGLLGILISATALFNLGYWYNETKKGYPPIHDITTDTDNPPSFVVIKELRKDAPNPAAYQGQKIANTQNSFYSGLETIELNADFDQAFDLALENVKKMPWTIVAEDRNEGRIEAYHKLAWFGFIDDVVIRVDSSSNKSLIDIRSKSRIGRGDLGVNAKRIRKYSSLFK